MTIPEITWEDRAAAHRLLQAALDANPSQLVTMARALQERELAGMLAMATLVRTVLRSAVPVDEWHMLPQLVTDTTRGMVRRDQANRAAAANPFT